MTHVFNGTALICLWIVLFVGKYATLSVASQVFWLNFNPVWYIAIPICFLAGLLWFSLFSWIANAFGISIYHGATDSASQEKTTQVSYTGEVKSGFFSDRIEIKPKYETSSEFDRVSTFMGYFVLLDGALFGFGIIEKLVPVLAFS